MKHIGIVGTRSRDSELDFRHVEGAFFRVYEPGDQIVSGQCYAGGDRFAEILALMVTGCVFKDLWKLSQGDRLKTIKLRKAPIILFPANWSIGRHAGFVRNTDIANKSDILIACVAANRRGGTEDTIKKFCAKTGYKEEDLILV